MLYMTKPIPLGNIFPFLSQAKLWYNSSFLGGWMVGLPNAFGIIYYVSILFGAFSPRC